MDNNSFISMLISMVKNNEISQEAFIKIANKYRDEQENIKQDKNLNEQKKYVNRNINLNTNEKKIHRTNKLTKEEYDKINKERNITIILSLGIIFILLAGIIFGTTTWDVINNIVKVIMLFGVSILFFAISIFTNNKLKIEKTSFAFWILGVLFLPIILLAIGFFQLLGDYLSIYGEGRYIYGIISTIICLPFFLYSAKKYKNTYFIWVSLINTALLYNFILKSLNIENEIKIFMWTLYLGSISLIYTKIKKYETKYLIVIKTIKYYSLSILVLNMIGTFIYSFIFTLNYMYSYGIGVYIEGSFLILTFIALSILSVYWIQKYRWLNGIIIVINSRITLGIIFKMLGLTTNDILYYVLAGISLVAMFMSIFYYFNKSEKLSSLRNAALYTILFLMTYLALISFCNLQGLCPAILIYITIAMIVILAKDIINKSLSISLRCVALIILFFNNIYTLAYFNLLNDIFTFKEFHVSYIFLLINVAIIYLVSIYYKIKKEKEYNIYFYMGHVFLVIIYVPTLFFDIDRIILGLAIAFVSGISILVAKNEIKIRVYLYIFLTMIIVFLGNLEAVLDLNKIGVISLEIKNVLLLSGVLLFSLFLFIKEEWKNRLNYYVVSEMTLGLLVSLILNSFSDTNILLFILITINLIAMMIVLKKENNYNLYFIPIGISWLTIFKVGINCELITNIIINLVFAIVLICAGFRVNIKKELEKNIVNLYCNGFAFISIIYNVILSFSNELSFIYSVFMTGILAAYLWYSKKLINKKIVEIILNLLSILVGYLSYSIFIGNMRFLNDYKIYFLLIPSIIIVDKLIDKYFEKSIKSYRIIIYIWYGIVSAILLLDQFSHEYLKTIIFMIACITSIFVGFKIRSKMYFVGGVLSVIASILINTRAFWSNIPWWIYLLVSGIVLVIFASKHEIKKNTNDNRNSLINKIKVKFQDWK